MCPAAYEGRDKDKEGFAYETSQREMHDAVQIDQRNEKSRDGRRAGRLEPWARRRELPEFIVAIAGQGKSHAARERETFVSWTGLTDAGTYTYSTGSRTAARPRAPLS